MNSVNGDVLDCVGEAVPWRDVLREHNCDQEQMDAHATKICTDYIGLSTKRAAEFQSNVASAIVECKRRSLEVSTQVEKGKCTRLFE